jgi:hypothetical protein
MTAPHRPTLCNDREKGMALTRGLYWGQRGPAAAYGLSTTLRVAIEFAFEFTSTECRTSLLYETKWGSNLKRLNDRLFLLRPIVHERALVLSTQRSPPIRFPSFSVSF